MAQSSTKGVWLDMKDLRKSVLKMSPVELRAVAYGITPFYKLNDNILYGFDDKGETKAVYCLPDPKPDTRSRWDKLFGVPECVNICGYNLHRRHSICSVCRWRKIKEGKLPPVLPITVYVLSMGRERKFERVQVWLTKKVTSCLEIVSLYGEQHGNRKN